MTKNLALAWSFVVALGGFLFGFDTAVISGAEQSVQNYWKLNDFEHGLTMAIALIGTIVGAVMGAYPSDKLGRRNTLFLVALLYLFSALGTALAQEWTIFVLFRLLGGIGVGISSVTAPIYIAEISPASSRDKLVGLFQFNIVLGILIAYLSNYYLDQLGVQSWRWMLGVQAVPSLVFFFLIFLVPESPTWLLLYKQDKEGAEKVLRKMNPENHEQELERIKQQNTQRVGTAKDWAILWDRKYRFPVVLAVLFVLFNQASGINTIIYYAPRVFEMAGLGTQGSLLSTVAIGLVNFAFTLIAINFIDRIGRRKLMLIGSLGLIVTLLMVSSAFYSKDTDGMNITLYLMMYVAFFALSQGAVIWVFIAEIFPEEIRAKGKALGSLSLWVLAALVTFFFPTVTAFLGGGNTFLLFAICMVLQLVFVWKWMPETMDKSLERMEKNMITQTR